MTEEKLRKANELFKELEAQKDSASYILDTENYLSAEIKIIRLFNSKVDNEIKARLANVMFKATIEHQQTMLDYAENEFNNFLK